MSDWPMEVPNRRNTYQSSRGIRNTWVFCTKRHDDSASALHLLVPRLDTSMGTFAWSMLQVCLFDNASDIFFLSSISSRSGDERSGRKGTKTGARAGRLDCLGGDATFGCGACTRPGVGDVDGDAMPFDRAGELEGIGCGYWDGGVGCGSRPEELVNGCTARGSKEASAEGDMMVAA